MNDETDPWKPFWSCNDCKGHGVWLAKNKHKPESGVYAFRCACSRGENDARKQIPQFKQAHIDEGFYFYEHKR